MSPFPDIKTCCNGQIGKKGCWQIKGMVAKLGNKVVCARHVGDIPQPPTKPTMDPVYAIELNE